MSFESHLRFADMSSQTITDGLAITGDGNALAFASPTNSPKIVNGLGIHANASGVASTFYIVFPEDIECATNAWRMWLKFKHGSSVSTNANRVRLIGRKSVPGTSDDADIASVSYSGSTHEVSSDGTNVWVQAGCVSDFYRNFYVTGKPDSFCFGYAGGLGGGKQLVGGIHQSHGPRLHSNTGTDSVTDYSIHDTMKEYAYNAVYPARTEPRFQRMRAFSVSLALNGDRYLHSAYIRHGSIFPSDLSYNGPAIINVSSAIIGDNGAEYEGYIRFPWTTPVGIVFFEHPNANTQWQNFHDDETKSGLCNALLAAGYIVCSQLGTENSSASHYKASNWGAPDGRTYRDAFIDYMADNLPTLPLFCIGSSMGFTNALVPLLRQTSNFLAIVGLSPVTNISRARDTEGFSTAINAGWENDWTNQKEANDPHLNLLPQRTGWMQRTPMLMVGDLDGDTTINQTLHGSALKDNLNAYGGSAVFTDKDGAGHIGAAVYDATNIPAFLAKFISGGSGDFTMIPSADSYSVLRKSEVAVPVAIHRANHTAQIDFTLVDPPTGITIADGDNIEGSSPTLRILASNAALEGLGQVITLRASDGTNVRNYPLSLDVLPPEGGVNLYGSRNRRDRRRRFLRLT